MKKRWIAPEESWARWQWYLDYEKRLDDAVVAQYGIQDESLHPDGVHWIMQAIKRESE